MRLISRRRTARACPHAVEAASMSPAILGVLLFVVGLVELLLLVLIGVNKQKPVLILAGLVSGLVTMGLGLMFYLGKIPLG
jgi:hypothetical protein